MIKRKLSKELIYSATKFPAVAVLGPRQSGKTTLTKATFPKYTYISLENIDIREFAKTDPRGFLKKYENPHGIILDEIQNAPDILSYVQTYIDTHKKTGYFILTGSQNFLLNQAITQTLAGRISILTLLPLSIDELSQAKLISNNIEQNIFYGGYPRIYDENIPPTKWVPNYIRTYIERDVRQIQNVTDLTLFQTFIKLCAGRIGQLLNLTSLGNDCGISSGTAKKWLSLLEASYIVFLLQPHYKNFSKRLIKSPKIYFYDTGLACSLLGLTSSEQISTHYLRGNLFESYVLSECMKQYHNNGQIPPLYFWRDKHGHEIDCIIEQGDKLTPIEIKAGHTISKSYFANLSYWNKLSGNNPENSFVVYAGDDEQKRKNGHVLNWRLLHKIFKK